MSICWSTKTQEFRIFVLTYFGNVSQSCSSSNRKEHIYLKTRIKEYGKFWIYLLELRLFNLKKEWFIQQNLLKKEGEKQYISKRWRKWLKKNNKRYNNCSKRKLNSWIWYCVLESFMAETKVKNSNINRNLY